MPPRQGQNPDDTAPVGTESFSEEEARRRIKQRDEQDAALEDYEPDDLDLYDDL